jgi:hypothetical protein
VASPQGVTTGLLFFSGTGMGPGNRLNWRAGNTVAEPIQQWVPGNRVTRLTGLRPRSKSAWASFRAVAGLRGEALVGDVLRVRGPPRYWGRTPAGRVLVMIWFAVVIQPGEPGWLGMPLRLASGNRPAGPIHRLRHLEQLI